MAAYGYRAVQALVLSECRMQLKRAAAREDEVLNVPIVLGPVGVGKTSIARHVAHQLGVPLIKINCGEASDPSEFGMPVPFWVEKPKADEHAYMPWVLNRALHNACVEPAVLFFDDIDKAPAIVEGALLSIFGERTARDRMLHSESVIVAAGNRVVDDALARRLSESLRTRGTVINLEASLADYAAYAKANPHKVHSAILGFLHYRPELLHRHDADADRFPTPRGWNEASAYLYEHGVYDDILENKSNNAWEVMIAAKCGEAASKDFIAWYTICSRIDVELLLTKGELDHTLGDEDAAIVHYAAIFALAQYLNNNPPKKSHVGVVAYLNTLHPEHRVALLTQLSSSARTRLAKTLPATASILLSDLVPLGI